MKVVNVRVAALRPAGYSDLKAWCADPANCYVGRGRVLFVDGERYPPADSVFCNAHKIGPNCDRAEALKRFRADLQARLARDPLFLEPLRACTRLGCWCAPEPCHADILVEMLEATAGAAASASAATAATASAAAAAAASAAAAAAAAAAASTTAAAPTPSATDA